MKNAPERYHRRAGLPLPSRRFIGLMRDLSRRCIGVATQGADKSAGRQR